MEDSWRNQPQVRVQYLAGKPISSNASAVNTSMSGINSSKEFIIGVEKANPLASRKLIKPLPPHQEHHTRQRSIDYSKELNKTLNRLLKEHQSTIGEKEVKDSVAKLQETVTSPTPTLKKKQTEGNTIRSRMELANQPHKAVSMRTVETDTIPREETKSFANS